MSALQHQPETKVRTLWQVLGGYAVVSWVSYQVVLALRDGLGLPDEIPFYALILLLLGLPMVIATWLVQRRLHARPLAPGRFNRLLTWKRTIAGGALAFVLLAVVTLVMVVTHKRGTLLAQGVIDDDQPMVLADFSSTARDTTLGAVVTEALRVDLLQSDVIRLAQPSRIEDALARMKRDPAQGLDAATAREVAEREGLKAVVEGDVKQVGAGYLITARIAGKDTIFVAVKEEARDSTEFIPAVNRLSRELRKRAGESLKSIRAGASLERATTSSLPALRKFSEAALVTRERYDMLAAAALLEDAIALDSTFGAAWHGLAVALGNASVRQSDAARALRRAYALRDRMTERERLILLGTYENRVNRDYAAAENAYLKLIALDSTDAGASNNLGLLLMSTHRLDEAQLHFRRSIAHGGRLAYGNLAAVLSTQGRQTEALELLKKGEREFATHMAMPRTIATVLASVNRLTAADSVLASAGTRFGDNRSAQLQVLDVRSAIALIGGQLRLSSQFSREYRSRAAAMGLDAQRLGSLLDDAEATLLLQMDKAAALRELDSALRSIPLESLAAGERPYGAIAELYYQAGEKARGDAMLTALEKIPDNEASTSRYLTLPRIRAISSLNAGPPDVAVAALRKASEDYGCLNCVEDYLASAYERAGMPDSAIAAYERFNTRLPTAIVVTASARRPLAMLRLAELYDTRGDIANATRVYADFLQLMQNADPELQPLITRASARLLALRGRG
jgi:eukaryotic-like serine/threonine-protein kinase